MPDANRESYPGGAIRWITMGGYVMTSPRFDRFRSSDLGMPSGWEVPAFDVVEYGPRQTRYCVLVPVINEGAKMLTQMAAMRDASLCADVILCDGGSTDGSTDEGGLVERGVSALLTKRGPGRLSAQLRMGFAYALVRGYEGVIIVDGNGKDGISAIPRFMRALDEGYHFIQGSRYLPGGLAINTPLDRHLAVKWIHAPLVSFAAGIRYTDSTNGFRAFSASLLRDPLVAPFRAIFDRYNLHYYLAIRAARLGYHVLELPVTRQYPAEGKTPTKISGIAGRIAILRELLTAVFGGYDPADTDLP